MARKNYDEVTVVRDLSRNNAIKVLNNKTIEVNKNATTIGNGTFGRLDFLQNYCGYHVMYIASAYQDNMKAKRKKITREDKKESKLLRK